MSGWDTSIPSETSTGTYYVWYKVLADGTHKDAPPACVTVTIEKANNPTTVSNAVTVIGAGKTVDLKESVTLNGAAGNISYAFNGDAKGCSLNGSVLTTGDKAGDVIVNVSVEDDEYYNALAVTPITVTIIQEYPLWVGGARVTSANRSGSGWVYKPADSTNNTFATLTLTGASISGNYENAAIYALGDLTINVVSDSMVTGPDITNITKEESRGIKVLGPLTINGNGVLTARGGNVTYGKSHGVEANSVIINGKLTAEGGTAEKSYGISGSLTINSNGSLTATGNTRSIKDNVKNAVVGTGWTNVEGTVGKETINTSTEGQTLISYKKVKFPADEHSHNFSYTASGATITATCVTGSHSH